MKRFYKRTVIIDYVNEFLFRFREGKSGGKDHIRSAP